jgi:hypothetical protein
MLFLSNPHRTQLILCQRGESTAEKRGASWKSSEKKTQFIWKYSKDRRENEGEWGQQQEKIKEEKGKEKKGKRGKREKGKVKKGKEEKGNEEMRKRGKRERGKGKRGKWGKENRETGNKEKFLRASRL